MIPKTVSCPMCGYEVEVATYRKFVKCPVCGEKYPFEGFEYEIIHPNSSMYASVEYWMDCPACRSRNMYFDRSRKLWECPDCRYTVKSKEKDSGVFWFCDDCDTYLNVQEGFDARSGKWICTECGYENDVTYRNIIFGDGNGDNAAGKGVRIKKAISKAGEIGSKVGRSLNEAKEKVSPVAEKTAGNVVKQSKKAVEAIGTKAQEVKDAKELKKKKKLTIVSLPDCSVRLIIPEGYEKVKKHDIIPMRNKAIADISVCYRKRTELSDNLVMVFRTSPEYAMDPDDKTGLIDGIHKHLEETQGLVEVKSGETSRGNKYIYSIVKNLSADQGGGVRYYLRLNLFSDEEIIELQADFTEIGITGARESIGFLLAQKAGLANITNEGFKGWFQDPYDPEYKKGRLKNLSENEGFDALLPEHPLSQARELLLAVLMDELIDLNKDNESRENDTDEIKKIQSIPNELEKDILIRLFEDSCKRKTYHVDADSITGKTKSQNKCEEGSADDSAESVQKKRDSLDSRLKEAVTKYNAVYTLLNDHGTKLFSQRERSIDLLDNVENLINSIANHPKEFDSDIAEIKVNKKEFKDVCDFAKEELEAAQRSAVSAGAGVAGGIAVVSLAPSAAMWIATTFGTASTGTAISTLSGAAATNAALAWLGGGALAASGGGMAAGEALLALAGPVGWGIAGATLLTSVVLFTNKKIKLDKEKKLEIDSVLKNTEQLKETDGKLSALLEKTDSIRSGLTTQYTSGMSFYGKSFTEIPEDGQILLGTIVNNAKALARSLGEGV